MVDIPHQKSQLLDNEEIVHGFFGRQGGVSSGVYNSLNACLHKGDDDSNVLKNRNIICQAMGINHMVTLRQVHRNEVLVVDEDTANGFEMDAMVTNTPGILLAIQTADCAPILLADPVNKVIGAVHAGWRSAVAGIVKQTVKTMQNLGANKQYICATIGPCIGQASFEVGSDVFIAANRPSFFTASKKPQHYLFDLSGYILDDLKIEGIVHAEALPFNTYELKNEYFSYRRSCHHNEPCGGQLSVIGLV